MDSEHIPKWIKESALFKQSQHIQQSVELHKWYESEKAGYDIGWEKALLDWKRRFEAQ